MLDPANAYLEHIVSRIQQDVQFLVDQNKLAPHDASTFLARLPSATNQPPAQIAPEPQPPASYAPTSYAPTSYAAPSGPPPQHVGGYRAPPPPPAPKPVRARALWAYNEKGSEPNDLSFSAGDIVEIVSQTNDDWWTGRINGRQGLFPSNHVEKLEQDSPPAPSMPMPGAPAGRAYKPFMAAYQAPHAPPPQMVGPGPNYGPVHGALPPPNAVAPQQEPIQEPKKNKISGLKNTFAQSAVGGAGFGAGAAVGSGIINAIF